MDRPTPIPPERLRALLLRVWFVSLCLQAVVAATLSNPGAFDACYYFHVAENLAAGRGMVEDVVWNYLDRSQTALALPHASHLYWMPLTTWLAWAGMRAFGWLLPAFHAAQVPFVLLASTLPPLSAWIAATVWRRFDHALAAAVLTLATPSYLQVWVVTEPVTPFCVSAAACFLACVHAARDDTRTRRWLWAGAAAGLAHLTRADGGLVAVAAAWVAFRAARGRGLRHAALALVCLGVGYLAIMMPWFVRNTVVLGSPLPVSVTKTLWLHDYAEIFSYERHLGAAEWSSIGVAALVSEKMRGAFVTLAQLLHVFQWVLPLFAVVGFRATTAASRALLAPWAAYAVLMPVVMSLAFTQPAQFGSLFRAASALIPWGMALAPEGVTVLGRQYARLRKFPPDRTGAGFCWSLVAVMVLLSAVFHAHQLRSILPEPIEAWNHRHDHYVRIHHWLDEQGFGGPVLVVDPPGFTVATKRPSIVVPSDGPEAIAAAADRFGASWLILESNVPSQRAVWRGQASLPGFDQVTTFEDGLGTPVRLLRRTSRPADNGPYHTSPP